MPMGAQGAPKHFHGCMGRCLALLNDPDIRFFQDDIFIGGQELEPVRARAGRTRIHLEAHLFRLNWIKSGLRDQTLVLGILHDRLLRALRIPPDKLKDFESYVTLYARWRHDPEEWRRYARKIVGSLNWLDDFLTEGMKKARRKLNQDIYNRNLKYVGSRHADKWIRIAHLLWDVQLPFIDTSTNHADLYFDSSASGAAVVVYIDSFPVMTYSMEFVQEAASAILEARGALNVLNKFWNRISREVPAMGIQQVSLLFDNLPLVQAALNDDSNTETGQIATRIKDRLREVFTIVSITHVPGVLNPADLPSRTRHNHTPPWHEDTSSHYTTSVPSSLFASQHSTHNTYTSGSAQLSHNPLLDDEELDELDEGEVIYTPSGTPTHSHSDTSSPRAEGVPYDTLVPPTQGHTDTVSLPLYTARESHDTAQVAQTSTQSQPQQRSGRLTSIGDGITRMWRRS
eukprot:Protomagalhaensia_wolfi_Nauph_80__395@NODE_1219_length_1652_cov_31_867328_g938_i0_p1_GENE_NODE_1219_length_1652_cov_31_867328_g938_i0NODE_1219_length_1652_cov_31_867328_g938_i0_p1_ORF_typecomplete_len521_score59_22RVT_1/PF00078_27/5_8e06RVT_1/PF00078_27/1_9e03DNA_pol_viral_C/PF00336_18/3_6e02DNA_pol_viral_C/PF00336_18/0_013_NODE_1219_length_1652_cov_31_867328_g938_i01941564